MSTKRRKHARFVRLRLRRDRDGMGKEDNLRELSDWKECGLYYIAMMIRKDGIVSDWVAQYNKVCANEFVRKNCGEGWNAVSSLPRFVEAVESGAITWDDEACRFRIPMDTNTDD